MQTTTPTIQDQAEALMPQLAGYVGVRTVAIGLRHGLIAALARQPDGMSAEQLADERSFDPDYTAVWCRSALAAGVCERADGDAFRLAPHMATLLLDEEAPEHAGATFRLLTEPEMFDGLAARLESGERLWWRDASPDFIDAVGRSGRTFYARLIPDGLDRVPGLTGSLQAGAAVLDTACGVGAGLVRLARTYPEVSVTGVDGDAYSVQMAEKTIDDAGLTDRIELIHSPLEDLDIDGGFDLVINNISMHECRDMDTVTDNVRRALDPGGWFVISDLPFPTDDEGLRSVPGRIMAGVQFWEALIDDQLQPVDTYLELLDRHSFTDIDTVDLAPVHTLTFGRRPSGVTGR